MRQPGFTAEFGLARGARYGSAPWLGVSRLDTLTPQQRPDPACERSCDFAYQSCLMGCDGDESCQYSCWQDLGWCISGCSSGGGGGGGGGGYCWDWWCW